MQRRETGLLLIVLAVLGASLLTETRRDVAAASPQARDPARSAPAARQRADAVALDVDEWIARLKARGMNTEPSGPGLFGGTNWQPQPDPAATQPAKPQTPPFPFVLLGRMTLGDSTAIVVSKGDVAYPAKVGQVIEQFRIDRIDEDGLRVTYVPNGESREYRYEQLYASADAVPLAGSPVQAAPQMQQPQATIESPAARAQPKAPAQLAAGAAAAASASAGLALNPLVQGAAAPIGGMVITPTPPGGGMVVTPTPPGNAMVMTPSAPGAGMVITPTPPGEMMKFTPGAAPGAAPPQTSP